MTDRMDRVAELIKREVSVIINEEANNPDIEHVTVTRIEVSRDMREAKVFCVDYSSEKMSQVTLKSLKSAAKFIRGKIAERLSLKFTPRLSFFEDLRERKEESIDELFEKIAQEHQQEEEENSDE